MSFEDFKSLQILLDPVTGQIFHLILRSRLMSRYEIKSENVPDENIQRVLGQLEMAGLIGRSSSSFEEFDKFYPTASGLMVEKMFK